MNNDEAPEQKVEGQVETIPIPKHVWEYANDQELLARSSREIHRFLTDLAANASIQVHNIDSRVKTLGSYEAKSGKKLDDGKLKYADPKQEIHDCVAARVIVYTTRAREALAELIVRSAEVRERKNPGSTKHNGYDSEHVVISSLKKHAGIGHVGALSEYFKNYGGLEIQIRSVAGHAWAEYEHDVRYKPGAYQEITADARKQIDQWFVEAGGLRKFLDTLFEKIEDKLETSGPEIEIQTQGDLAEEGRESVSGVGDDELNQQVIGKESLTQFIRTRFPDNDIAEPDQIDRLLGHLAEMELETIGDLDAALAGVPKEHVATLMDYPIMVSGARRLDDELLAVFGEKYVESVEDADRSYILALRLRRVKGKFAIYSFDYGAGATRPVTAANAVRQIAKYVAEEVGTNYVEIDDVIALNKDDLQQSSNAKTLKTKNGEIYVRTNFSRHWAENTIQILLDRIPNGTVKFYRAGDLLSESPTSIENQESTTVEEDGEDLSDNGS